MKSSIKKLNTNSERNYINIMEQKYKEIKLAVKYLIKRGLAHKFKDNINNEEGTELKSIKQMRDFMLENCKINYHYPCKYNPIAYYFDWEESEEGYLFWLQVAKGFEILREMKLKRIIN